MKTKLKKMVEQAKEGPTRNDTNADEDEDEDEFSAKEGNDKEGKPIVINITFHATIIYNHCRQINTTARTVKMN